MARGPGEQTTGSLREIYRHIAGRTPPWTPLYLHHRALEAYVERTSIRALSILGGPGLRILDVGCGEMPYRRFLDQVDRETIYEGADIPGASPRATVIVDPQTQSIAAAPGTYDLVISFQVLEHVSNPLALLTECRRVLRPGGLLFMTLPFMFEYHAVPRDFRRWTHEGIAEDLVSAGYVDIVVEPIESDLQSLLVINQAYLARHLGHVATKPLFLFLNMAALIADRIKADPGYRAVPLTLGVMARKPKDG